MSKPRPDLSVSIDAVKTIIERLKVSSVITHVYLTGSRSPLSKSYYPARLDSDWDLIAVHNTNDAVILFDPRKIGVHADLIAVRQSSLHYFADAVEIYPNDEYNILG